MKNLQAKTCFVTYLKKLKQNYSLVLFFSVLSLQANNLYFQVTISSQNKTVSQLLDEIESLTNYRFVYKTSDVDLQRKINLKVENLPLEMVLERVFKDTPTTFTIIENQIILKRQSSIDIQQTFFIKGIVTDSENKPFPGVTVLVQGTGKGSTTDDQGGYAIEVKNGDVVLFSHIGFKTILKKVSDQIKIDVVMEEDLTQLSEVVITGIYERKSESFTGSSITVTKEDLKKVGNANFFQAIQNIDPSIVLVDNFSLGSNPNTLPDIQIRGTSTFPGEQNASGLKGNYLRNPNQPLFILNGFETNIEQIFDLDINRIERITILKNAQDILGILAN